VGCWGQQVRLTPGCRDLTSVLSEFSKKNSNKQESNKGVQLTPGNAVLRMTRKRYSGTQLPITLVVNIAWITNT